MTQPQESDYDIDIIALMTHLGVDPNTVETGTTSLTFIEGKAILRYGVVRAVPANLLAVAMMHGARLMPSTVTEDTETGYVPDSPVDLGLEAEQ